VWRSLAAGAILVVPLAFGLAAARDEFDEIDAHSQVQAADADVVPPFAFAGYANVPLLRGIRRAVPQDASVAFVPRAAPEIYLQTGWVRWVAFAIAPRLVVERRDADWLVYVKRKPPRTARALRFGDDWLVRAR
jgi:hypothetical protein